MSTPLTGGRAPARDDLEVDGITPEEARALWARAAKRLRSIITSPDSTNRDVVQAATILRLAAGAGSEDAPTTEYVLPMPSLIDTGRVFAPDGIRLERCPTCGGERVSDSQSEGGSDVSPSPTSPPAR